jgi:formylglycine-generating enzyme required for sulfatase activity
VWEWNDAVVNGFRGVRGGAWADGDGNWLASSGRYAGSPGIEDDHFGFRVASVPEPTSLPVISNLTVAQRPGTKLVDITYDVASTASSTVTVSLTVTNGTAAVSATSLTGAVGPGVATGTGKAIVWDAGADWHGNVAVLGYTLTADEGAGLPNPAEFALIPAGSFQMGGPVQPAGG